MNLASRVIVAFLFSCGCASATPEASIWLFKSHDSLMDAESGPAKLGFFDPNNMLWHHQNIRQAMPQRFGLPALPVENRKVLRLRVDRPDQGLQLQHKAQPNGVLAASGQVSNYSLILDVLWPEANPPRASAIFQTQSSNTDDAELFIDQDGGMGVNGRYHGALRDGQWHRIVVTVQAATGTGGVGRIRKFVDGHWLGGHITPGQGKTSRWGLDSELLLFADNDGESAELYIAGIMFVPRQMSMQEVQALGGVHGAGPHQAGPSVSKPVTSATRHVSIAAHRGNSCCAPENTLPALQQALAHKAEIIEVDVRLTSDGQAVLMHDEDLERTTTGKGRVVNTSWNNMRRLDAGSWFADSYRGTRVARLSDAIRLCKDRAVLYLDVKDSRLAPAIARAVREAGGSVDDIRIWETGDKDLVRKFRKHLPGVSFIWGSLADEAEMMSLKKLGVVGFELDHELITASFVANAHRNGLHVTAFTIHDPQLMHELIERGVDIIETDYPAEMKARLPQLNN